MVNQFAVGLDIGGTKIRGVVFDGRRIVQRKDEKYRQKPPAKKEFLRVLFGVADTLAGNLPMRSLAGIGVGTTGRVAGNRVFSGPNLTVVGRINIPQLLKRRYRLPVTLTNDVKAAALAEWKLGAAKRSRSMAMITLGSGLGGAYIKDGKLQTGTFSSAYEMGFIVIDAERARRGKRGDFEWFGSEKFFISRGLDPIEAETKARRGDRMMQKLWREFGEYLGIGIASIVNVLEPEVFVVGGGIAHAWPLFAPSLRKTSRRLTPSQTRIVRAKLGSDAGAIGAALLIQIFQAATATNSRIQLWAKRSAIPAERKIGARFLFARRDAF